MGWATRYIKELHLGKPVIIYPRGNSMTPRIKSGDQCRVRPLEDNEPTKGDIVLCRVNRKEYLHLVISVRKESYQIGNNHGRTNGWISRNQIFGKLD